VYHYRSILPCLNICYILADYTTQIESSPTARFKHRSPFITYINISFGFKSSYFFFFFFLPRKEEFDDLLTVSGSPREMTAVLHDQVVWTHRMYIL